MEASRWQAARKLAKAGDVGAALRELGEAIVRAELDSQQLERAGALARKLIGDAQEPAVLRVAVLGACNTHWLTNVLAAVALGQGQRLALYDGEYDNVQQELHGEALKAFAPRVVVLLPWFKPLEDLAVLSARVEQ